MFRISMLILTSVAVGQARDHAHRIGNDGHDHPAFFWNIGLSPNVSSDSVFVTDAPPGQGESAGLKVLDSITLKQ